MAYTKMKNALENSYFARTASGITAIIAEDLETDHLHQRMVSAITQKGKTMRLIDADALIEFIVEEAQDLRTLSTKTVGQAISKTPTVDAVPVIRCRDCIYWKRYCRIVDGVTSNHVCGRKRELDGLMHRSKADDFCSWAKRRNDETD